MTSTTTVKKNQAAFLEAKDARLEVKESVYTAPGEGELVIKNAALAINPFDWSIQEAHNLVTPFLKLPLVLGTDVAGEVVEIGEGVTRFRVGDRVVAHAVGLAKTSKRNAEGGFQHYTVARQHMTSPLPPFISYEAASVMPLGLSTAACALYDKDQLNLPHPSPTPPPHKDKETKLLLIWGASTSVGLNAVQLAKASGCEVVATCSPKNFDLVRRLGASHVFDYRSDTAISDIVKVFEGRKAAGAISIGQRGALAACADVLSRCRGAGVNKFIAQVSFELPMAFPKSPLGMIPFLFAFMRSSLSKRIYLARKGVQAGIFSGDDLESNEVGRAIYESYLPQALENRSFVPSPSPRVVGQGLECIQQAMDLQKKGVSAEKLIVVL